MIARLLYDMVEKDQKWEWTKKQEGVFRELKERFTRELVLTTPDLDKKMRIEVDILNYATEEILSMKCENGKWWLVVFLSKSLKQMKRNYEIHDKEILAVIRGLVN